MVKFIRLNENAMIPTKGSKDSAGFDLYYCGEQCIIPSRQIWTLETGIATEFDSGLVGLVCDRSGLGKRGVKVFGGVVDSDYRGEWKVILGNLYDGNLIINQGDRIAQVLFIPVSSRIQWVETNALGTSERNIGGFGSTGI